MLENIMDNYSDEEFLIADGFNDANVSGSYMGEKTPIWCDDQY